MLPLPPAAEATVSLLTERLRGRVGDISRNVAYYKGEDGRLRFASSEFAEYFQKRFEGLSDNWCMPVAQAPVERMNYLGLRLEGTNRADATLARAWERNDANRGLSEALLMMTVAKRSFGLVSPTPRGARITFEHPDSAIVDYDPITRERRSGMVIWQDDTNEYGQLSGSGAVVPLIRPKLAAVGGERRVAPDAQQWFLNGEPVPNPLGVVPLVEFRNAELLDGEPASDIEVVRAIQDAINLVWAYMLNGLDYATLPQRVAMADEPREAVLDAETGEEVGDIPVELDRLIKERIIFIGKDAKGIAEWSAASPQAFAEVIELAKNHIAAQTRTPSHYLSPGGSNIPAAGYELAEAGLVSKTNERINFARPPVREINRLVAIAEGNLELAQAIELGGKPMFAKAQFRSEHQLMDGLQKMRDVGFPLRWIAEEYGLPPTEVDRLMDMVAEEQQELYGGYPPTIGAGAHGDDGSDNTAGG